jgi:formylglycine-generating enzyme required for sulfatase activity
VRSAADISAQRYDPLSGSESGLMGYWPFAEGAGSVSADRSGNEHDATLVGAGWSTTTELPSLCLSCGLSCVIDTESDDDDFDTIAYGFEWTLDGAAYLDATSTVETGDTVPSADFGPGQDWVCTVTPNDGDDNGDSASANYTTNSPPSVASVTVSPDPAYAGDVLGCTYTGFTDIDGDADASTLEWLVNGVSAGSSASLSTVLVHDDVVECIVTPADASSTGTPVSDSVTISNSTPTITSVSISPNPASATDTLTCAWSGFSDADGDSDQSILNWTINGVNASTSPTLFTGFVGGDTVACSVTANDGTVDGNILSDTVVITNTAPVVTSVTLSPANPDTQETVYASYTAADTDGDSVSVSYLWTVDGAEVAETGSSLSGAAYFDKHQEVTVTVTPHDGASDGLSVTATPVYAVNTAPEAPFISIIPAAPIAGADDLVCSVDVDSYDLDGDSISYDYEWAVDGAYYSTGSTVPGTDTNAGETWTCTVTPNDGDENGASSSTSVVIEEAAEPECWALDFDGDDDWVELSDVTHGTQVTYEMWLKGTEIGDHSALISTKCGLVGWAKDGADYGGVPHIWAQLQESCSDLNGSLKNIKAPLPLLDFPTDWWHLAVTMDETEYAIYIDGQLEASGTLADASNEGAYAPAIAVTDCINNVGLCPYKYGYSELSLSTIRISDNIRYGSDFTPASFLTDDANTAALWLIDEGAGSSIDDSSGNGWNGTVNGATWVEDCPDSPVHTSSSTGYGMNYIPPGTFEMGCTAEMDVEGGCDDNEFPVHSVSLTQGFYIGVTEVTQAQWTTVMGSNPSYASACGDDCPVEKVSWDDAVIFANALSVLDGLSPAYDADAVWDIAADGYRLPTEAEWEYAARAGDGTAYAGSDISGEVGWYVDNSGNTPHPVAGLIPNGFGLYDMSGNVWEWTWDWYDEDYYDVSPATDPAGPVSGTMRVVRSGSFTDWPWNLRVARHNYDLPVSRDYFLGLRLVRTVHVDEDGDGVVALADCDDTDPDIGEECPIICEGDQTYATAVSLGCTHIYGNLSIYEESGVPDGLTGLSNLQTIGGNFYLGEMMYLTNLNGLESLTSSGALYFNSNYSLTSIESLRGVSLSVGSISWNLGLCQSHIDDVLGICLGSQSTGGACYCNAECGIDDGDPCNDSW